MPEGQKYDKEFHHKLTIHYDIQVPNSDNFPSHRESRSYEKHLEKMLRKILTKGGPA